MTRRAALEFTIASAGMFIVAAQACAPKDEEPSAAFVTQAIAGDCGYDTSVCVQHAACESWDLNTPGDGLGYTVAAASSETGPSFLYNCTSPNPGCENWDEINPCPAAATARRDALLATRPGISQPARDGFSVSSGEVQDGYWEDGCGQFDQGCSQTWSYHCLLTVNNYPTPVTAVRPWCPCAAYQPVDCEPNNVVVGGTGHTCALIGGGLKCWGANMNGQLGNGMNAQSVQPVSVSNMTSGVYTASTGGLHTCAIKQGAATCWGQNVNGQLGNAPAGDNTTVRPDSNVPVAVTGLSNAVQGISAGNAHTCAVVFGAAKCWGNNDFGQIGDNSSGNVRRSPASVSNLSSGVQAIAAGGAHSCAVVNGGAKCWGFNGNGQLGKGTGGDSLVPAQVKNLTSGVQAITTGNLHSCAIVNGGVQCWGDNSTGQLGPATSAPSSLEPVPVTGLTSGVQAIAAGNNHTCARTTGGTIWCWGDNGSGQLGAGLTVPSSATPVQVSGLASGGLTIASGFNHSCAIGNGGIQCWGLNANAQLERPVTMPSQSNVPLPINEYGCTSTLPVTCGFKGCADGTIEQTFGGGMVGCAGAVTYANRGTLCSAGYQPVTAAQWIANRGGAAPTHHYWTSDQLRYNGSANACFVSTTAGTNCGADTPMRVCVAAGSDPEGNVCNWGHCGLNATAPDQYFGGCFTNTTAGTLCVPVP